MIPAADAAIGWSRTATKARPWRVRRMFLTRNSASTAKPSRKKYQLLSLSSFQPPMLGYEKITPTIPKYAAWNFRKRYETMNWSASVPSRR